MKTSLSNASESRPRQSYRVRPCLIGPWLFIANGLIVVVAVVLGDRANAPARHFGESCFVTWVSGAQLLSIAYLNWQLWRSRGGRFVLGGWREASLLWALIAAGFLFLAVDELVQIHEQIDQWIHALLRIKETAISDRLDDLIVAGYAVIGFSVLFVYRREFRLLRGDVSLVLLGCVLLLAMIVMDVLFRSGLVSAVEESFKLFSETAFLAAFYSAYRRRAASRRAPWRGSRPSPSANSARCSTPSSP